MSMARPNRNREEASDLICVLVSNAGSVHKQVSRLCGDVRRLYGRIDSMHRAVDRLHRKIDSTRARIRILRSQDRVRRRQQSRLISVSR
jgi:septal ring factor EnvC (AmiA/AmiB activator)